MERIIGLFVFLLFHTFCIAQDTLFSFSIFQAQDSINYKKVDRNWRQENPIYEDEQYSVYSSCSGEWGGSLRFTNKTSNERFECKATCPIVIYKIDGKYIVTCSLAHLNGSSEILEIGNPELLKPIAKSAGKKSEKKVMVVGSNESKSEKGTRTLVDSVGVMTLGSFPYNNELYYIVTDNERTFLAKIQNGGFSLVKLLLNEHITGYSPRVMKYNKGGYQILFNYDETPGYFEIEGSNIIFYRFK